MRARPRGHTHTPLDDRDDTVEVDFADTSNVDASEHRRLEGMNGVKHSKGNSTREREGIGRS
jgi:hypothetical protein